MNDLRSTEREAIVGALLHTRGSVNEAAVLLGITRHGLRRKLEKHRLHREFFTAGLRTGAAVIGMLASRLPANAAEDEGVGELSPRLVVALREAEARAKSAAHEANAKLEAALRESDARVKAAEERRHAAMQLAVQLATPPGSRIRHVLRAIVGRQVYEHDIVQTIADAQEEWLEAHTRGEVRLVRVIHLRLFVQLAAVLGRGLLGGLVRAAIGIFKSG